MAEPFLTGGRVYAPAGVDARSLTLDREGFVWVMGSQGTFRFDGVRYLPAARLGLPVSGETRVEVTSDGTVWAHSAIGLWRLEREKFRLTTRDLGPMAIAAAGELLYASPVPQLLQVWYREKEQWKMASGPYGPTAGLQLHGEPDGRVWFGGLSTAEWVRWSGGKFERGRENLGVNFLSQQQVVPLNEKFLYASNATRVLRFMRDPGGQMRLASVTPTSAPLGARPLGGDSRELHYSVCGLWASSSGAAMALPEVRELTPDFKRGVWGARGGQGILFVGARSAVRVVSHESFPDRPVRGLARQGERLYVARADASALLQENQSLRLCDETEGRAPLLRPWGLPGEQAPYMDIDVDPDGSVWVLARNHGVIHLRADGSWIETVQQPGATPMTFATMREMTFSVDGRFWVASKENLHLVVPGKPLRYAPVFPGGHRYTAGFVRDSANQLFAITEGGLVRYDQGAWRENPWPDCMLSPRVRTLAIASAGEHWIGYRDSPGFTRATRTGHGPWQCQHFEASGGFPGDTQFLAYDRQRRLWRGSEAGLFVARGTPLKPSDWIRLGEDTGVPNGEMHQLFHEEPDGAVMVALGDRLVRIPPRLLEADPGVAPQVSYLEGPGTLALKVDKLSGRLGDGALLLLSALPERELAAAAPLEYRWGSAESWRRLDGHELALDGAPGGEGRLELRYAGAAATLTLPFRFEVLWWRTLWFRGALGAGLLLALVAFARPFVRRWRFQLSKRRFLAERPGTADDGPPPHEDWPPGTLLRDRYRVDGLLARGGFSDVFAATDRSSGARVVVKRLRQGDMPVDRLRRRFTQEIAAVSMVRHEGILPILDTWIGDDGVPHLVLPRVEGPTLRQRLSEGPLPRSEARALLRELAGIIGAAHAQSVVHSDLKPENVLLVAPGKPVVIDFGTSSLHMQGTLSEYSRPAGSVQYMAPEQLLGRYSRATDIYAFALLTIETLTGRRYAELVLPFDEGWEAAVREALTKEMSFSPAAAAVLAEGLRFDPLQRAQDLQLWYFRLEEALGV